MDDGHEPATKADIAALKADTKADIAALKTDIAALRTETKTDIAAVKGGMEILRSEVQHGYDDLKETLRDSQTELLKAFYSYTGGNNERLASAESEAASLKKRLGMVEGRLTDVERRLNTPPAQ